jgi:hypothetical protein
MYTKITDKQLEDWKETLAKSGVSYQSDEEYREALRNLAGFFDVLIQIDLEQKRKVDEDQQMAQL